MQPFDNIRGALEGLTHEEKVKLRLVLDEQLKVAPPTANGGASSPSTLIGMFANEPELIDHVLESVYEHRSRPLRSNGLSE